MVTFDDAALDFYGDGGSFTSGGFTFTQGGDFGGVADTPTFSLFGNAPTGNATQFYGGFNDSTVTMTRTGGGGFRIGALDFGFISPIGGAYAPGDEPAALVIEGLGIDGVVYTLLASFGGADANGEFGFRSIGGGDLGALQFTPLQSATFAACSFDGQGACVTPFFNLNQFALDNINEIPEPGSLALSALALGLAGALRRRQPR